MVSLKMDLGSKEQFVSSLPVSAKELGG